MLIFYESSCKTRSIMHGCTVHVQAVVHGTQQPDTAHLWRSTKDPGLLRPRVTSHTHTPAVSQRSSHACARVPAVVMGVSAAVVGMRVCRSTHMAARTCTSSASSSFSISSACTRRALMATTAVIGGVPRHAALPAAAVARMICRTTSRSAWLRPRTLAQELFMPTERGPQGDLAAASAGYLPRAGMVSYLACVSYVPLVSDVPAWPSACCAMDVRGAVCACKCWPCERTVQCTHG
jgi:hypothetical protein